MLTMRAGDRHGGAAGMAGLAADGLEQQGPAGDGLAMMVGIGQADEQVPPVEHDAARHQPAALEVMGREDGPAPLVFQPKAVSWRLWAPEEISCYHWGMSTIRSNLPALPLGEQPVVEQVSSLSVVADTFAGRIHVEWDNAAPVTPLGQLPFFIEYLKQGGLFDGWVADCPLHYTSPNAPKKRDLLGTVLLSVLAGHWRYAHITTLRCDPVNPPLLGMDKVVSEDGVRRGVDKIEEQAGVAWLQEHLDYFTRPLLSEPWILDIDTTVKPLYGHQEGAVVGYNPAKRGRPSHSYHRAESSVKCTTSFRSMVGKCREVNLLWSMEAEFFTWSGVEPFGDGMELGVRMN